MSSIHVSFSLSLSVTQKTSFLRDIVVVSPDNNSSDQMAAASVPFTADQRQELDRQTMIFKYMLAGVPVPSELILTMNRIPSTAAHSQSNSSVGNNNPDSEWRCRKSNGKKWRCPKNVAPGKKYCDHHSHKSRSRKHVELPAHSNTNI